MFLFFGGITFFAEGRESIEDHEKSEWPCVKKSNENITKVATVLKDHRDASCRLLEKLTGILKIIEQRVIKDDLKKRKLCPRFVPHALTTE